MSATDRKERLLAALDEEVRSFLEASGVQITTWSDTVKLGFCPFHDDTRNPSFSVFEGTDTDGHYRWKCKAQDCGGGGNLLDFHMERTGLTFRDALDALCEERGIQKAPKPGGGGGRGRRPRKAKIAATYPYKDEEGGLLYETVRWEWEENGVRCKDFSFRRPPRDDDPAEKISNGWVWSGQGIRRVPYRLPAVLKASSLFFVEGEKDVETLRELTFPASCIPGGVDSWGRGTYADFFAGKTVVFVPDRDQAGEQLLHRAAPDLLAAGAEVLVWRVPLEQDGADVTDWVEAGGTREELRRLVKQDAVAYAPPAERQADDERPPLTEPPESEIQAPDEEESPAPLIRPASEILVREGPAAAAYIKKGPPTGLGTLDQLLHGLRPGWYTVEGDSGAGKSTLVSSFVQTAIECGVLDEEGDEQPFPWLILPLEEGPESWRTMMLARLAQVNGQFIATGEYPIQTDAPRESVETAWPRLLRIEDRIYYPDPEAYPISLDKAHRMVDEFQEAVGEGNGGVVIDPVHRLHRAPEEKEYDMLERAIGVLLYLRSWYRIPIITNVHLNVEGRVKGSSGFHFSADIRLKLTEGDTAKRLNKDNLSESEREIEPYLDLLVLKNKGLPGGMVTLRYHKPFARFRECVSG